MKSIPCLVMLFLLFSCSKEKVYPTPDITEIYFQDGYIETIFKNKPNGINVIFMGEGYVQKDLEKERGLYRRDAMMHLEFLFENPPFSEYKEYFNAYIVFAESEDEGPNYIPREKKTALGVIQGEINPIEYDRYLLTKYVQILLPDYDIEKQNNLVLLSIKNGEGGIAYYGESVALFGNKYESIMTHEVGHAIANLGDEYDSHPSCNNCTANTELYPNLDNKSNLEEVKWKHFINLQNYQSVDAYEGGGYTKKGIWRPEKSSIMTETWGSYPYFNAPSREAIVKKIMELNGLEYSFEEFLKKDKIALDTINSRLQISKKSIQSISCSYKGHLN